MPVHRSHESCSRRRLSPALSTSQTLSYRPTIAIVTISDSVIAADVVIVVGIFAIAVIEIRTAAEIAIGAVVSAHCLLSVGKLFRSHFEDFIEGAPRVRRIRRFAARRS